MPNPDGYNAFGGPLEREPAYGDIVKLEGLSKLAATAQPTAVGAPRRSQQHATGKDKPRRAGNRAVASPPAPPSEPTIPPEYHLFDFWTQLAAEPGASSLVQEIAQRAAL